MRSDEIRSILAEAFAFVKGAETTESALNQTFEQCLQQAIDEIEVDASHIRPSVLSTIRSIRNRIGDAVEQAKQLPQEDEDD